MAESDTKLIRDKDKIELKLDILEYAQKFGLSIYPDKDVDRFCESTVRFGHCICKDDELYCPCEEALTLIKQEGHCTCRLFMDSKFYSEELAKYRDRWRRKYGSGAS